MSATAEVGGSKPIDQDMSVLTGISFPSSSSSSLKKSETSLTMSTFASATIASATPYLPKPKDNSPAYTVDAVLAASALFETETEWKTEIKYDPPTIIWCDGKGTESIIACVLKHRNEKNILILRDLCDFKYPVAKIWNGIVAESHHQKGYSLGKIPSTWDSDVRRDVIHTFGLKEIQVRELLLGFNHSAALATATANAIRARRFDMYDHAVFCGWVQPLVLSDLLVERMQALIQHPDPRHGLNELILMNFPYWC